MTASSAWIYNRLGETSPVPHRPVRPRPLARAQPRRRWPDRGPRRNNRHVVRVGCVRRRARDPNDDSGSRARRVTCDPAATPRHASPTQSAVRGVRAVQLRPWNGGPPRAAAVVRVRSRRASRTRCPAPPRRTDADQAAERHDEAARYWAERGDQVRADLEQRNAVIERDQAQLERDRAAAEQRKPSTDPAASGLRLRRILGRRVTDQTSQPVPKSQSGSVFRIGNACVQSSSSSRLTGSSSGF